MKIMTGSLLMLGLVCGGAWQAQAQEAPCQKGECRTIYKLDDLNRLVVAGMEAANKQEAVLRISADGVAQILAGPTHTLAAEAPQTVAVPSPISRGVNHGVAVRKTVVEETSHEGFNGLPHFMKEGDIADLSPACRQARSTWQDAFLNSLLGDTSPLPYNTVAQACGDKMAADMEKELLPEQAALRMKAEANTQPAL